MPQKNTKQALYRKNSFRKFIIAFFVKKGKEDCTDFGKMWKNSFLLGELGKKKRAPDAELAAMGTRLFHL